MPIFEDEIVNYEIPKEYEEMLNEEVLKQFAANLLTFFPYAKDAGSWFFLEGTCGWHDSLVKALRCNKPFDKYGELVDYYEDLPWYNSDMFDDRVLDLAIKKGIIIDEAP